MSEEQLNQTSFNQDQVLNTDNVTFANPQDPPREVKRPSPLLFLLVLIVLIGIVAGVVYFSLSHSVPPLTSTPIPSLTPTPTPQASSLKENITPLLNEAKQADPDKNFSPFPPVDLHLRLKDAQDVR